MRAAVRQILFGNTNPTLFELALKTSLVPEKATGSGTPTFTRSSTATVMGYLEADNSDATQKLLTIPSGIPRFEGARFIASNNTWSGVFADGAPIPDATLHGYLAEGARINIAWPNRDLTHVNWVATTTTVALTATGIDGVTNAASTLTATGADSTVLQTVTLASSARVFQPYIKRVTGTGAVSITTNNGTTWTDVTALINSSTYTRVQFSQTVANPVFGFKLATSGDVIAVDYADNQGGTFASSPILTTTAAVTRAADVLSYPSAGNFIGTSGSVYAETVMQFSSSLSNTRGILGIGATPMIFYLNTSDKLFFYDGVNNVGNIAYEFGSVNKMSMSFSSHKVNIALNGTFNSGAFSGTISGSIISIGTGQSNTIFMFGTIRNIKIWKKALKDAKLISLTT